MTREFTLEVDGESFVVTVRRDGDQLIVERDGRRHVVTVVASRVPSDSSGGDKPTPAVAGATASGSAAAGTGGAGRGASGATPTVSAATAAAATVAAGAGGGPAAPSGGTGAVCAPMVGVVREIHAKPGDRVTAGDLVITMEAMKMEIYVTAPIDGVVESISCAPGDSASEGATLAMIAEAP